MVETGVEKRYQWKNINNQYIAVITGEIRLEYKVNEIRVRLINIFCYCGNGWWCVVSLMNILAGVGNGWMTPMVPVLKSDDTPLVTGPLTNDEISWISSSFSVGSTIGGFLFTWVTAFIDSKRSTTCLTIPAITSIAMIYFGNTFTHMLVGRIVSGILTGAVQSNIAIYTSEIANDKYGSYFHFIFSVVEFLINSNHFSFTVYAANSDQWAN